MNSNASFRCITFLGYLYSITFCQCNYAARDSLLLTKLKGEYHLTRPDKYDAATNLLYFLAPKKGKTYRFCPSTKEYDTMPLHKIEEIPSNSETPERKICDEPIRAILSQVHNAGKLKNIIWNNEELELFHAGFILYNNGLNRFKKKWNFIGTQPDYGENISKHKFVLLVEYYYDKKKFQTVAAQYKLRSIKYRHIKSMYIHNKPYFLPGLFASVDSPEYLKYFKGTVEDNWLRKMSAESQVNPLSLLQFASFEHFTLQVWNFAANFSLNYVPIWRVPKLMWIRVEIFARIVARILGDLQVTAGVTGTMTLSNKEVIDINGFKMPKFFWKVFEYRKRRTTYGVIVVLNCNPFDETKDKICDPLICKRIGWIIWNDDFLKGEIYCCEMTSDNIKNLNANFLSLKKRTIFNLKNWRKEKKVIEKEYKEIILIPQYQIPTAYSKPNT